MTSTSGAARNTIRIIQTHDADGNAVAAESVHVVGVELLSPIPNRAMDSIATFSPRRTDQSGVYAYGVAGVASGQIHLEDFGRADVERVDDLILMHQVRADLGDPEPFRNPDFKLGNAFILRSNNPWIAMTIAIAFFVLGVWGFTRGIGADQPLGIVSFIVGGLIVLASAVFFAMSARRVGWWRRARASAMRIAGRLPSDLTGL